MQDRSDDFGITALAAGRFHQMWWARHPTAGELLADAARTEPPAVIEQDVRDATLLVESPLTDRQLEALWVSATRGHHDIPADGLDGRRWFRRIIEVLTPALDAAGIRVSTMDALDFRPEVAEPVKRIVRRFTIAANFPEPVDEEFLRQALTDLASSGLPELGLRFFLSLAVTHDMPIGRDLYAEITEASRLFGYGTLLPERLTHLLTD